MVRKSQEFYDAIANIPKPTGGREHPQPHAEIKASVVELVQNSTEQRKAPPSMSNTEEPRAKNVSLQQEPSITKKMVTTDSAKTRDLVREKIDYSAEERFDNAVRAIELRYREKARPFQKTLADFTSFAETDPLTFYAVQPHIERLTTSIRELESQRDSEIERARADYFFARGDAKKFEEDSHEKIEQLAEKFDQKIHTINSLYEKKITRILSELQPFFPESTAIKQRFTDEFNLFLTEIKRLDQKAPDHGRTPVIVDSLVHAVFEALQRTSHDLNSFHKPKGFPGEKALFETTIHALQDELAQTLRRRDQELHQATTEFTHALAVFHLEDTSPTQAAIKKIEERYQHDTAPIRARIERLVIESQMNPLSTNDNQTRILGLEKLLTSMAKLRDREIDAEMNIIETHPSQETVGYESGISIDLSPPKIADFSHETQQVQPLKISAQTNPETKKTPSEKNSSSDTQESPHNVRSAA